MMVQIAKKTGAGKVAMIGTRDYRLEEAKKWGADYIFNVKDEKSPYYVKDLKSAIADVTHGKLADRAINPAGPNEAFEQAIDITGGGAILVHFGLPNADDVIHVPADAFHKADKQIRASWLAPGVWPQTIAMIANGLLNLEPLVSQAVPLSEAAQAIINLRERKGNPIKVQVTP
jgi:threonine dehydrogenase-like Zn-dependent dehydrogenase